MAVVVAEGVVEVTTDGKNIPRMIARDIDANGGPINSSGQLMGERFSTSVGRGLRLLGGIVATAGLVVATGIGLGVGAIVTNGVRFEAAMQSYTAAFTPLLGGADAAEAKLSELSTFAARTPFTLEGLAGASQTLLAFGEDTADLLPDLQMLGDISQGNQEKLSGLALVFGQVQSNGHLLGQDLLQMINQGFNPLQVISEKTGESMTSLRDRMEKGQVSFDEVRQAMEWATSEGGMFFGAMELGSKTLVGAWSTLQDGASILSGAIVGTLTPSLTGILNDGLNPLLGGFTDLVNGVDGAQESVDAASQSLLNNIENIGPVLGGIAKNLGTVFTAAAPAISAGIGMLLTSIITILPSIIGLAGQIVNTLIGTLVAQAPGLVQAAVPMVLSFVTGLVGQIPSIITAGVGILVALVTGITDSLPTLLPAVVGAIVGGIQALVAAAPDLLAAGLALISGLVTGLIDSMPVLIAALPSIILGITDFIITSLPIIINAGLELFTALVDALPDIIVGIVSAIPPIIVGINTALMSNLPAIITAGIKLFVALVKAMPTIITEIVKAVPSIISGLVTSFTSPSSISQLSSAGQNLIRGLWSGISSLGGWLWSQAKGLLNSFVNNVKGFFGIKSPSTLMHDEVGAMLGYGVGGGFIDSMRGMLPSMLGTLGEVVDRVTGSASGIGIKVAGFFGSGAAAVDAGTPGGSEAGIMVGNGGTTIQIGNVLLDPSKIETLQDLIDMFTQLGQVARAGRPKPAGGF